MGQAFKGAAVGWYCKPLITKHMEASGAPEGRIFWGLFLPSRRRTIGYRSSEAKTEANHKNIKYNFDLTKIFMK